MKRVFFFVVFASLWGCKKGGGDVTPAFDSALVAGSWKLSALTIDPSETGVWGTNVTDLLSAYRTQIGDECIDSFRMNTTAAGKISRTTTAQCDSRTLDLFGFAEQGSWTAAGSTLNVLSPYESATYYNVTVDQSRMVWHRLLAAADSEDRRDHVVTLTWERK